MRLALIARKLLWALAAVAFIGAAVARPPLPGFKVSWLDRTCKACDDFSQFATGGWLAAHPIPAKAPWVGHVTEMRDETAARVHELLEEAAAHPKSPAEAKAGKYYAACMDEAGIAAAGVTPIAPELARAASVTTAPAFVAEVAHLHDIGVGALFTFSSEGSVQGFDKPMIVDFSQAGLSMPDRSFYLDAAKADTFKAFNDHVATMFALAGEAAAASATDAQAVVTFETAIAQASKAPGDLRDPIANTHPMPFADAAALIPAFDLGAYAAARKAPQGTVDVGQPEFTKALSQLLASTPLPVLTAYLRYHILNAYGFALAPPIADENFHFTGTVLNGTPAQAPRNERCANATAGALAETVGALYDAKYFSPAARDRAAAIVQNVIAALRSDIPTLTWMTAATKKAALTKLDGMLPKVGYPDKPRDYSSIHVARTTYLANIVAATQFRTQRAIAKLGKPLDRTEWSGTSATINAYYSPSANSINMYAGMLQSPLFDERADDAYNYGAAGWMIGHEMTHGFDDNGRHFDEHGALRDWWTPADSAAFEARASCVRDQFDAFEVLPGVHANGKLELGEAMADLGGATLAYRAFEKAQAGKPRRIIDGFTPEQRFFIGMSILQTEADRDTFAKTRASSEPHPLGRFRIDGTLANTPAFAAAFACPLASAMVRTGEKRCSIW